MTSRPRRPAGSRNHPIIGVSIDGAFEEGRNEIESLLEEIEAWKESLESNNMEHLPKYEEVEECFNVLRELYDALQALDCPDFFEGTINYTQDTRQSAQSRAGRLSNAETALAAALDGVRSWLEENEELEVMDDADAIEDGEEEVTQEQADERAEQRSKAEEFADELEEAIGLIGNVEFPGMY